MPQARRGGSSSGSGGRSSSGSSRSGSRSSSSSSRSARSTAGRGQRARATGGGASSSARAAAGATDAQFEAVAQRIRKLNERIIAAGKGAGETTLTNYEKALKAMASAVERGPGSSDVEWVSHLANTQAKFIRDVTAAWAAAARDMIK